MPSGNFSVIRYQKSKIKRKVQARTEVTLKMRTYWLSSFQLNHDRLCEPDLPNSLSPHVITLPLSTSGLIKTEVLSEEKNHYHDRTPPLQYKEKSYLMLCIYLRKIWLL